MPLAIVFGCLWLVGALYTWWVLRKACFAIRLGAPFLVGEALFLSVSQLANRGNLAAICGGPCLAVLCISFLTCCFLQRRAAARQVVAGFRTQWHDLLPISLVFALYFWRTSRLGGADEINHYFFASQIIRGKFPPAAYAFSGVPAKYHFGWDLLLANACVVGKVSLPTGSDVLTYFNLLGSLMLAAGLLRALGLDAPARTLGILGLFLGGGLMEGVALIFPSLRSASLSLFTLYHQHAWSLALNIFLLITALFTVYGRPTSKQIPFLLGWLFPIVFSASMYAATLLPFIGLICGLLLVYILNLPRKSPFRWTAATSVIAFGIVLVVCWTSLPGMLFRDSNLYDSPRWRLCLGALGLHKYALYEGAYLLMAPIGFFGLGAVLTWLWNRPTMALTQPIAIWILASSCVIFTPLPLLVLVENAAYWDNFCKFNVFGILSAWVILPWLLLNTQKLAFSQTHKRLFVAAHYFPAIYVLLLLAPVLFLKEFESSGATQNRALRWKEAIGEKSELLHYFKEHVPINDQVLILNSSLRRMYPIDKITNKPDVNLYLFIGRYFGSFVILAQSCGVSIVNFYDYNFLYNRTLECKLYNAIDAAFSGNGSLLHDLNCSHVLVMRENAPKFLANWVSAGLVSEERKSEREGWVLYRTCTVPQ
jgi:hypothetical protein